MYRLFFHLKMSNSAVIRCCNKYYSVFRAGFEYSCNRLLFVTDINNENPSPLLLSAGNFCLHSTFKRHYHCWNVTQRRNDYLTECRYYSQDERNKLNLEEGRTFTTITYDQSTATSRPEETSTETDYQPERILSVEYWKGLPRLTIPLPSRKERCRFTLKPISNTVGDFIQMICQEDRGIDRVILCANDGTRIASSNTIELLMHEQEFFLVINDTKYTVRIPESQAKSFAKDDMERLADVRNLVSQLYEALQVNELHVHTEQELTSRLENIRTSLKPLEEERQSLEKKASIRASLLTWIGLSMMGVQFGILARLTWWEYSWDIMEPVTYFVTYGTAMAMYAYFAITREDYILPDVRDRQHLIYLHKKAKKSGFDVQRYNELRDELNQVETDLDRLKDPPHFNSPRTTKPSLLAHHHYDYTHVNVTENIDNVTAKSILDDIVKYTKAQFGKAKKFKWKTN